MMYKPLICVAIVVACVGLESLAIQAAYKRGYQKSQLEREIEAAKQRIQAAQWRDNLRLEQEKQLTAIAASYAALQSQSLQYERKTQHELEAIIKNANGIYSRDCLDDNGLQQLNKAINGQ